MFATVARSLPTALAIRLLRHLKFIGETAIGQRFFDRIQVLALNVFDERHLEQRTARRPAPRHGRRREHEAGRRSSPRASGVRRR